MNMLDARFKGEIFRQDYPQIIAMDRHLAKLIPARFQYSAAVLQAGQAVGRRTADGYFYPYMQSATGGEGTGVGVLLDYLDFTGATGSGANGYGTRMGRVCVGGAPLFNANLVGATGNFLSDVKGRVVTDATGTALLIW